MHWLGYLSIFCFVPYKIQVLVSGLSTNVVRIVQQNLGVNEEPRISLNHHGKGGDQLWGVIPHEAETLAAIEETVVQKLNAIKISLSLHDGDICHLYLSKYLEEYEEDAAFLGGITGVAKHKAISDNPILSFKMIRRVIYSLLRDTKSKCRFREEITQIIEDGFIQQDFKPPSEAHVYEIIHSLVTIQFIQGLNAADDIRVGNLHHEVKTNLGLLTFDDCVEIAKEVLEHRFSQLGYQWVVAAEMSKIRRGFKKESMAELDKLWDILKEQTGWQTKKRIHMEYLGRRVEFLKFDAGPPATYAGNAYCRGENSHVIEQQPKYLVCFEYRGIHPYFLLKPLRLETIVYKPFVFQFHNFVTEKEIEVLTWQNDDVQELVGVRDNQTRSILLREQAHIKNQRPIMKRLIWKIETVTKLRLSMNVNTGHIYLRGSYNGLGCYDNLERVEQNYDGYDPMKTRDKFGSMLIFTSDVKLGGHQVFPKVGAFAEPLKGSALFHYNFDLRKYPEPLVEHKTCPVIVGVKTDVYVPLILPKGTKPDFIYQKHLKLLKK